MGPFGASHWSIREKLLYVRDGHILFLDLIFLFWKMVPVAASLSSFAEWVVAVLRARATAHDTHESADTPHHLRIRLIISLRLYFLIQMFYSKRLKVDSNLSKSLTTFIGSPLDLLSVNRTIDDVVMKMCHDECMNVCACVCMFPIIHNMYDSCVNRCTL